MTRSNKSRNSIPPGGTECVGAPTPTQGAARPTGIRSGRSTFPSNDDLARMNAEIREAIRALELVSLDAALERVNAALEQAGGGA